MNKPRFLELVRDPNKLEFFDLEKLEEVVALFPYFQAAHLLIAKLAKEESNIFAAEKLNRAAVSTLDRKNLKKILNTKSRKLTVFINTEPSNGEVSAIEDLSKKTPEILPILENLELNTVDTPTIEGLKLQDTGELPITTEIPEEKESVINIGKLESAENLINSAISGDLPEITKQPKNQIPEPTSDFYSELERNLEILRKNKQEAQKITLQNFEKESQIIENPTAENLQIREEPEKNLVNPNKEDTKEQVSISSTIDSSRLEEVLLNDIETRNKYSEKDLLIEYFDYLAQIRQARWNDKKSVSSIIDQFISKEPSIPKLEPKQLKEPLVDLSEKSTKPKLNIISENFAKILVLQGKIEKAIEMYEALSLKNPEKKPYFANLIIKLKNKHNIQ